MKERRFETSKELRLYFERHLEQWKEKTDGTLSELAARCGVSSSYLSQVGRYGRIPSTPVLFLLALNFGLPDASEMLRLAGIRSEWPYPSRTILSRDKGEQNKFVSVQIDLPGLTDAIRSVMREETRQKTASELLGTRPLRIGLNFNQLWMYSPGAPKVKEGIFYDFCSMLGVALQRDVETVVVPFADHVSQLQSGKIDLYGPILSYPGTNARLLFTAPLYRAGVSALMRKKPAGELLEREAPKRFEGFSDEGYRVAVLRNSLSHLLANTRLKRPDSSLILCDSDEEALERLILKGIKNPAHVFISNSLILRGMESTHKADVQLTFYGKSNFIDFADNALAVRPDWGGAMQVFNDAIQFLLSRGGFTDRLRQIFDKASLPAIKFVESNA